MTLLLLGLEGPPLFRVLMEQVVQLPAFAENEVLVQACFEDATEISLEPFWSLVEEPPGRSKKLWARQLVAARMLRTRYPESRERLRRTLTGHPMPEVAELFAAPRVARRTVRAVERAGIELVRIPGGTFWMGSTKEEQKKWAAGDKTYLEWFSRESPRHEVTVTDFYMSTYPVTNEQYARFLKANPKTKEPKYWADSSYNQPRQPVVGVSWDDAVAFCEWAEVVLPTEAQWEYACRAGPSSAFWSGEKEDDLAKVGWYSENSDQRLHAVGEKPANDFGLFDMHGNVWEWCADWLGEYSKEPQENPTGPAEGDGRVVRGGSFRDEARSCRSAARGRNDPRSRVDVLGFRVALPAAD